ncbi:hypothetical protein MMC11_000812 [Xylographa trunciseda]|nr:hypothetical protein [Xylographa trunciseda]
MPSEDHMSDEYVAKLMSKDAKESTIRYSALGLQALLPKRPTTNAPRPNTRFLKNIIRETDSHNAALKSKETEEARLRLIRLQGVGDPQRSSRDRKRGSSREGRLFRYEDADAENGARQKRRRLDDEEDEARDRRSRRSEQISSRTSTRAKDKDPSENNRPRRRREASSEDGRSESELSTRYRRRRHHHRTRRTRSRSSSADRSADRSRHHQDHDRDKDRRRRRSRSRSRDRAHEIRKPHRRKDGPRSITPDTKKLAKNSKASPPPPASKPPSDPNDTDSDPLESLLGPAPPPPAPKVRPRGRGTFASSSAMDARFSSNYDPSVDVLPNSDSENDWDQALEALRDRRRWQQQGADRLRAAGFTEEEVGKWEKGGEKTEEDVRWRGRGEGREWDRGKVLGEDGVETRAEWGRLKGT